MTVCDRWMKWKILRCEGLVGTRAGKVLHLISNFAFQKARRTVSTWKDGKSWVLFRFQRLFVDRDEQQNLENAAFPSFFSIHPALIELCGAALRLTAVFVIRCFSDIKHAYEERMNGRILHSQLCVCRPKLGKGIPAPAHSPHVSKCSSQCAAVQKISAGIYKITRAVEL